jgi:hypothetical protein
MPRTVLALGVFVIFLITGCGSRSEPKITWEASLTGTKGQTIGVPPAIDNDGNLYFTIGNTLVSMDSSGRKR